MTEVKISTRYDFARRLDIPDFEISEEQRRVLSKHFERLARRAFSAAVGYTWPPPETSYGVRPKHVNYRGIVTMTDVT